MLGKKLVGEIWGWTINIEEENHSHWWGKNIKFAVRLVLEKVFWFISNSKTRKFFFQIQSVDSFQKCLGRFPKEADPSWFYGNMLLHCLVESKRYKNIGDNGRTKPIRIICRIGEKRVELFFAPTSFFLLFRTHCLIYEFLKSVKNRTLN